MATFNFPSSPTVGQFYTFDNLVWQYQSEGGWKRIINAGQVVSVFIVAGPFVDDPQALPVPLGLASFVLVNYL